MSSLIDINEAFYIKIASFLESSIGTVEAGIGIPRRDIIIYMPNYIVHGIFRQSQLLRHIALASQTVEEPRFMGAKIVENYQNSLVVSYKGIVEHNKIKPLVLELGK